MADRPRIKNADNPQAVEAAAFKFDRNVEFQSTITSPCVDFTNLGTVNPKIINQCNDVGRTVTVMNFDTNGRPILERILHLERMETRPIQFPGYSMGIRKEEADWLNKGGDEGSRFFTSYTTDVGGGYYIIYGKNQSADRFLAVLCEVYVNNKYQGTATAAIAPGDSRRFEYIGPNHSAFITLMWARLDPL